MHRLVLCLIFISLTEACSSKKSKFFAVQLVLYDIKTVPLRFAYPEEGAQIGDRMGMSVNLAAARTNFEDFLKSKIESVLEDEEISIPEDYAIKEIGPFLKCAKIIKEQDLQPSSGVKGTCIFNSTGIFGYCQSANACRKDAYDQIPRDNTKITVTVHVPSKMFLTHMIMTSEKASRIESSLQKKIQEGDTAFSQVKLQIIFQ